MALGIFGLLLMIWALGRRLEWSKTKVWGLMSVIYSGALGLQFAHPEGNPAPWAMVGGLAAMVWVYGFGLSRLKARVAPEPAPPPQGTFGATELERYARHIVLRELGGPGQKKLKNAKVLVIGAGGLGSPVLMYLAAAGVGTIGVVDDDLVDHSNLQRQVIHRDETIGTAKVHSATEAMRALNPYVHLRPYQRRLTPEIATELFAEYDVIIDGTDNFATRYLSNEAAVALEKPLVSGALAQWEGQLSVFDPARGGPCYQCIFPTAPSEGLAPSCAEAGVVAPLPGIIGSMMALEAVKLITGAGHILRGEMLIYDGLYGESRKITLAVREECPLCQTQKSLKKETS
jgi:molybdopterin/thiamine biosynthesis adenylyltransferase